MNKIIHLKRHIAFITGLALITSTAAYVTAEVAENVFGAKEVVATAADIDTTIKNLKATSAVSTISVTWDDVETADLYKVYVYDKDDRLKVSQTVTANSATFTSKKLVGQTYTVKVWAVVDGVPQEKSSVTVTTPADTSIQQLTATASYDVSSAKSTISVNWKAVVGATWYDVTVYDSNKSRVLSNEVTTNSASFTSDELFLAGHNYSVAVRAIVGSSRKQEATTQVVWDIDESLAILNIDYSDADITYVKGSVGDPYTNTTIRSTSSNYADMIKDFDQLVGEPGKRVSVNVDYDDYLDELPYEDDYYVFTSTGFRIDDLDFTISKEGYTFKGWYIKNVDGTETALDRRTYEYFKKGITNVYAKFWPEGVPDELPDVTGVQATASYDESIARNSITVSWDEASGVDGYKVRCRNASGALLGSWTVTGTSCTVTSLNFKSGSTVTVEVCAYVDVPGGDMEGAATSFTVDVPEADADTTIKNLAATATADSTINVTWTVVNGATRYKVYVYDSSGTLKITTEETTNSASFTSAKLFLPGETYTIKVWAVVNGMAQEQSSVEVTIPAEVIAVTNLVASAVTGYVTASWDAVDGATKYDIYYYNEAGTKLASKSVTNTSYTTSFMRGVVTGETITVQVRATLADGTVTEFTSATAVVGIGTPEDLTATKSGTTVTATWTALPGVDGYAVYFRDASGALLGTKPVTTNSVSSTSSKYGTDVYVTVKAYKLDENGNKVYGLFSESVKAE